MKQHFARSPLVARFAYHLHYDIAVAALAERHNRAFGLDYVFNDDAPDASEIFYSAHHLIMLRGS